MQYSRTERNDVARFQEQSPPLAISVSLRSPEEDEDFHSRPGHVGCLELNFYNDTRRVPFGVFFRATPVRLRQPVFCPCGLPAGMCATHARHLVQGGQTIFCAAPDDPLA